LFLIVIIQIQTRHVEDYIGKENTTISLMDWKIIMFDHEGFKMVESNVKSFNLLFTCQSKKLVTQKIWG